MLNYTIAKNFTSVLSIASNDFMAQRRLQKQFLLLLVALRCQRLYEHSIM